jgi:hypothetical protein
VIAAGDLALWALTSDTKIDQARGRVTYGNSAIPKQKVLPVYSARTIFAAWEKRVILAADLQKAARESRFPGIRRPKRLISIPESIQDCRDYYEAHLRSAEKLSVDIETKGSMITCIGFSPSISRALVVPFFSEAAEDGNYWRSPRTEYRAWCFVRKVLRNVPHTFGQNFQYDMQYLLLHMGIPCPNFRGDTMLLQHSLQPELPKGLGFLASIYTDEPPWKFMHKSVAGDKQAKRGDGDE